MGALRMGKVHFSCKYPGYTITMKAAAERAPGRHIVFTNGQYSTEDPKEIEAIKSCRYFGVWIHSDDGAVEQARQELEADYSCPECGKEFDNERSLKAHMTHHTRRAVEVG